MRLAVLTVSPHRSQLNLSMPITPAITGPVSIPMWTCSGRPPGSTRRAASSRIPSAISATASAWSGRGSATPPGHHVGVADGLDLLQARGAGRAGRTLKQVVEALLDLLWAAALAAASEVHQVGEQHGGFRKGVGDRAFGLLEPGGDRGRQHVEQQPADRCCSAASARQEHAAHGPGLGVAPSAASFRCPPHGVQVWPPRFLGRRPARGAARRRRLPPGRRSPGAAGHCRPPHRRLVGPCTDGQAACTPWAAREAWCGDSGRDGSEPLEVLVYDYIVIGAGSAGSGRGPAERGPRHQRPGPGGRTARRPSRARHAGRHAGVVERPADWDNATVPQRHAARHGGLVSRSP
jgi:hypothetical protein